MFLPLYISVGSGLLLVLFSLVVNYESRRGERLFLAGLRNSLDRLISLTLHKLGYIYYYLKHDVIRLSLHFLVHQILGWLLKIIARIEALVLKLEWHNRLLARKVRKKKSNNHLDALAEHKETSALSEKEKQEIKEKSLG